MLIKLATCWGPCILFHYIAVNVRFYSLLVLENVFLQLTDISYLTNMFTDVSFVS